MGILIGISIALIVFLSCVLAFNIVYTESSVKGNSMSTTFFDGDRVFINRFEKGEIGDIVVADTKGIENWNHSLEGRYIIKRLVAVAGDSVQIKNSSAGVYQILINGKVQITKHIEGVVPTYVNFMEYVMNNSKDETRIKDGAVLVKDGEVFLLGDNWEVSYDSSSVGPITADVLVGRVDIIVPKNKNIFLEAVQGVFKMWFWFWPNLETNLQNLIWCVNFIFSNIFVKNLYFYYLTKLFAIIFFVVI